MTSPRTALRAALLGLVLAATPVVSGLVPAQADSSTASRQSGTTRSPQATSLGTTLKPGTELDGATQYLVSANGQHSLAIDSWPSIESGNGYGGYLGSPNTIIVGYAPSTLSMQADGNLVYYVRNRPQFASNTAGNPGARLVLQDDGNAVVYSATNKALWSSGTMATELSYGVVDNGMLRAGWFLTSPDSRYRLIMQSDGNLVLYSGNKALWSSGTAGNRGAKLELRTEDTLVVTSAAGTVLWNANPRNKKDIGWVAVQSDGNVVAYTVNFSTGDLTGVAWQSGTAGRR